MKIQDGRRNMINYQINFIMHMNIFLVRDTYIGRWLF